VNAAGGVVRPFEQTVSQTTVCEIAEASV